MAARTFSARAPRAGSASLRCDRLDEFAPDFAAFAKAVGLPGAAGLPDPRNAAAAIAKSIESDPERRGRKIPRPGSRIPYTSASARNCNASLWRIFESISRMATGTVRTTKKTATPPPPPNEVGAGMNAGDLPPFIGIRIKPFTEELRERSIRTLDIFLTELAAKSRGELPEHSASRCRKSACRTRSRRWPTFARASSRCSISNLARCASS